MKREEIIDGVEKLKPWFHMIDLGDGIVTKTVSAAGEPFDHPHGTWQIIRECLPADLTGKSVLDVGCNGGFYAVEAKRRGASRVLGVDAQRSHVRQALFVRRALNLEIEFRRLSVYDLSPRTVGRFDVVLALGLIYHLKHLIYALENLWHVTKEMLIIETAVYPPHLLSAPFAHPVAGEGRTIHALGFVENPPDAKEAVFNWFLPGVGSLKAMLSNLGFDDVTVFNVTGERAVLVCRKHRTYADSRTLGALNATLHMLEGKSVCRPDEELRFEISAENSGFVTWLARGEAVTERGAVRLGTHLLHDTEEEEAWEYGRAILERDILPGDAVRFSIVLRAPTRPGSYIIEFDLVNEHLAWFEELGSAVLRHKITVQQS